MSSKLASWNSELKIYQDKFSEDIFSDSKFSDSKFSEHILNYIVNDVDATKSSS